MFRCPEQERAPAGIDVEETLSVVQPELFADLVELRLLCRGEGHGEVGEVSAGVNASRVKPQCVEVVGNVVVLLDLHVILHATVMGALPDIASGALHEARPPASRLQRRIVAE